VKIFLIGLLLKHFSVSAVNRIDYMNILMEVNEHK